LYQNQSSDQESETALPKKLMNKFTLLISLCIFSSVSWSYCVGDCFNGYGTYTWPNGGKYVGQWSIGTLSGQGTYTWVIGEFAGQKYVGQWHGGLQNGHGTYTWPSGDKYVGQFKDGKQNGQGIYTWRSGNKYVGQFKDDKQNGQGIYTWRSGNKYVGQFKDDSIVPGQGVDYLIDGRQLHFKSDRAELIGANRQTLRTNVQNNELDAIRLESVENKRRADELLAKQQRQQERDSELESQRQREKEQKLRIEQRQNRGLIVGIQRQLIEYLYLGGIADGIAGRNTSMALERFYQDTEIIRPSLDDYATITYDLNSRLLSPNGVCSKNPSNQSKYTVCFNMESSR